MPAEMPSPQQSPVDAALEALQHAVDRESAAIGVLAGRLESVLSNSIAADPVPVEAAPPSSSPLVQTLSSLARHVELLNTKLRTILDLLEV